MRHQNTTLRHAPRGPRSRLSGLLALALAAAPWGPAGSQILEEVSTPSFGVGARATALAETYVSEPFDVNGLYANPAASVFLRDAIVTVSHYQEWTNNIMNDNVTFPVARNRMSATSAGISVNHVGYVRHSPSADYKAAQYGADMVHAVVVAPGVGLGAGVSFRAGSADATDGMAASASAGIMYFPSPEISYGAAFRGLGSAMRLRYDGASTTLVRENLPRVLEVGAAMRYPSPSRNPAFILAIANEKVIEEDGLIYKGGVEYCPVEILALRAGYIVEPGSAAARYGMGLRMERFTLDWAVSPSKLAGRLYQVSFSWSLGKRALFQ